MYNIRNLSFKAVIICELETLYNHNIKDATQHKQVNDFVGDLNKIYLSLNIARDYIAIITSLTENQSKIIDILENSIDKEE